jgi:hypothetical protein
VARRRGRALALWVAWLSLSLAACASPDRGPCLAGGRHCAAAQVPEGAHPLRRGYRIGRYHWLRRVNRESGVPDVGIQAEWLPIQQ